MRSKQRTVSLEVTRHIWRNWKTSREKPALTFLELKHLAQHVNQRCLNADVDPREIDLFSLLDSTLNYYENLNYLDMYLKQLGIGNGEIEELGTEKLRQKHMALNARYKKLKQRIKNLKSQNKRLRAKLKKNGRVQKREPLKKKQN